MEKKDILIMNSISFCAVLLTYATLTFKGVILEFLIEKKSDITIVILLVGLFVVLEILAKFAELCNFSLPQLVNAKTFGAVWQQFRPTKIPFERANAGESFFSSVYTSSIEVTELSTLERVKCAKICAVLCVFMASIVYYQYFVPLFFLPLIAVMANFSSRIFSTDFEKEITKIETERISLLEGLTSLFKARKEVFFNWRSRHNNHFKNWYDEKGLQHSRSLQCFSKIIFKRELSFRLLIDLPHMFCYGVVFASAVLGKMTLGEAYVWFGITGLLVEAGSDLAFVMSNRLKIKALTTVFEQNTNWVFDLKASEELSAPQLLQTTSAPTAVEGAFLLRDNSVAKISSEPGFYRIEGSNGSGKSFLIETMLGMNTQFRNWSVSDIAAFRALVGDSCRVIENDAEIFPDWPDFWGQVFGFSLQKGGFEKFQATLEQFLGTPLCERWTKRVNQICLDLRSRTSLTLSSGEKVTLSFCRAFSNWSDDVRLLIADECDAFLDTEGKNLFKETLEAISGKVAVFYVCHTDSKNDPVKVPKTSSQNEIYSS